LVAAVDGLWLDETGRAVNAGAHNALPEWRMADEAMDSNDPPLRWETSIQELKRRDRPYRYYETVCVTLLAATPAVAIGFFNLVHNHAWDWFSAMIGADVVIVFVFPAPEVRNASES
jgi:hypothetical protein